MQCPSNSFSYNTSLCACNPGYLFNGSSGSCQLFSGWEPVELRSGVDYSINFPTTIFDFDSIRKFTQSQAVFLEATFAMLASWLLFCLFVRIFGPLGDGRSLWFKIRWWISRLDVCFATRHWLDDRKVVMKRKTELGGALSVASSMLFIGLFAALLYQIISKRSVEVHNIRATNAPDLASFLNDLEFNITAISGMSCSNIRGLGTLVSGNPGTIDYKVAPLSTFANFSCQNTSKGPTITLKCMNCPLIPDIAYIPWQFVDLPNDPATAVGFDFKLSAKSHDDDKHLSSVTGTIKNGSMAQSKRVTFRGAEPNIFKFNLFPRHYRNVHDLKLIQPLFHDFIPGSSFSDVDQLRASLESSVDGLLNMTLYVNFLSNYIVEIDSQNVLGAVSILADMGGLYCFSVCIFFFLLVQCEYRIKKLRQEDVVMRNVRNRRKAQERWDKLRKYVAYTWGCSSLDGNNTKEKTEACCAGLNMNTFHRSRSSHRPKQQKPLEMLSFSRKVKEPCEKCTVPDISQVQMSNYSMEPLSTPKSSVTTREPEHGVSRKVRFGNPGAASGSLVGEVNQTDLLPVQDDLSLPPPPVLQCGTSGNVDIADLQNSLKSLYDYNVILRDKLVATQSMLHALSQKGSSPSPEAGQRLHSAVLCSKI